MKIDEEQASQIAQEERSKFPDIPDDYKEKMSALQSRNEDDLYHAAMENDLSFCLEMLRQHHADDGDDFNFDAAITIKRAQKKIHILLSLLEECVGPLNLAAAVCKQNSRHDTQEAFWLGKEIEITKLASKVSGMLG